MTKHEIPEKMATPIIPVTPAMNARSQSVSDYDTMSDDTIPAAILVNSFVIRRKQYRVSLSDGKLMWQRIKSNSDRETVLVENIIAIQSEATNSSVPNKNEQKPSEETVDIQKSPSIKQFIVVYAKRMENSSNPNKWRHFSRTFQNDDSEVCQRWIDELQRQLDEQLLRPKRLLLFINPFGGKKQGLRIFNGTVKPILQLAGIDTSVVISQRSNHIRDFVMTQSLDHFDGIVCIGGDGTFSELFNGIIFRSFKESGWTDFSDFNNLDELPKMITKPLGVIPAGSTDTVAYCLNGTCDIRTTVLNIILGQVNGLDLSSVCNQNGLLKFHASVMSYGFLGDVAVESEKFRWMGPVRYDYSGFKKFLLNRGYDGEISFLIDPSASDPLKGPACLENCPNCTQNTGSSKIQTNQAAVIKADSISDKCDNNNKQILRNSDSHLTDNQVTSNIHVDIHVQCSKNPSDDNGDGCFMKTINGKFFMVNGANISCCCSRSPNGFSKFCHLCDGYIDLILVRHTSFLNNLRFLLAMSSRNCKITDLNHVEIYRTKRFSFKPSGMPTGASTFNLHSPRVPISVVNESNNTSAWNCDGEVIHDSDVSIRSHRGLINVYRRGLYNAQKEVPENESETTCCC